MPFLKVASMGGKPVQKAVAAAAKPFASMFLGASGAQFFLHDSTDGQPPLLVSFPWLSCRLYSTLNDMQLFCYINFHNPSRSASFCDAKRLYYARMHAWHTQRRSGLSD